MAQVISTVLDPIGFGFGEALTGRDSAFVNVSDAYGMKGEKGDKKSGSADLPALETPAAPQPFDQVQMEEKNKLLRAKQATTKNIISSPLGVTGSGNVQRKVLLGV